MAFKVKIVHDEAPMNPREWDNLGKLWCSHKRYTIGDELPWWWQQIVRYGYLETNRYDAELHEWINTEVNAKSWDEHEELMIYQQALDGEPLALWLPVYLYDHSGTVLKTSPFSSIWDSGQVGFIVATRKDVLAEYNTKRLTKKIKEHAFKQLEAEVEVYNQYQSGDVWGYEITDEEGEIVESCYGFFGHTYTQEEAQAALLGWATT